MRLSERLRDELIVAHPEKIPGPCVPSRGIPGRGGSEQSSLFGGTIKGADVNATHLRIVGSNEAQKASAVWKELRPAVRVLAARLVDIRHRDRLAAGCRYLHDWAVVVPVEEDDAVRTPRSTPPTGHGAELCGRPAAKVDAFELASREESNGPAVRRPERIRRSLRFQEFTRRQFIQLAQPEPVDVSCVCDIDNEPTVGRDLTTILELELAAGRRVHRHTQRIYRAGERNRGSIHSDAIPESGGEDARGGDHDRPTSGA